MKRIKRIVKKIIQHYPILRKVIFKSTRQKTSERILPEFYQDSIFDQILFLKHQFAYDLTKKYIHSSMHILDYGCGDGYGSYFLASVSPEIEVFGIDIDKETIKQAQKKYHQTKNLHFFSLDKFRKITQKFDLIVSFQVIEHVEIVTDYLKFLHSLLSDHGVLIIATPSRSYRLNENQAPWNPYHLREYSSQQFQKEIIQVFENSHFYSLIGKPEVLAIEFSRVASSRQDQTPFKSNLLTNREQKQEYSITDFWLSDTEENMDDGIDLFSISTNE
jgi:2-polyprenyl-3-methyl-5-hydroxy-6-metoxy-1,4-benzoquinol methylase